MLEDTCAAGRCSIASQTQPRVRQSTREKQFLGEERPTTGTHAGREQWGAVLPDGRKGPVGGGEGCDELWEMASKSGRINVPAAQ